MDSESFYAHDVPTFARDLFQESASFVWYLVENPPVKTSLICLKMCMRRQRESKTHFHREGFRCAYFETEERATLFPGSLILPPYRASEERGPENEVEERAAAFCNCFIL